MEESRHLGYAIVPAPHTELPVTFQAPYVDARDYWREPSRRTVFDYQSYVPQDLLVKPMTTFYGIMNHFFGSEPPRPPPPPSPHRQQYEYQKPYYIPGPKPLRASITKLEPTRVYTDYTTPRSYPQFVKILNDVLVQNSYKHQEPVLEKPEEFHFPIPTTYKPPTRFNKNRTKTPIQSIQDQLPPVKAGEDTRIPYISETTTHKNEVTTYGNKIKFPTETEPPTPLEYEIDVRNAPQASSTTTTTPVLEVETVTTMIKTRIRKPEKLVVATTLPPVEEEPTTEAITSTLQPEPSEVQLIKTMEPMESSRFKGPFPKKLHSRKVTTDATQTDYVSDLTLKSLTDPKSVHASIRFPNPLNMTSVINYVIGKYNATFSDDTQSLDAKILKDTNWDGYQPPIPSTTEPTTTTNQPSTTLPPTTTTEEDITTTTPDEHEAIVIATRITQTISKSRKRPTTTEEPTPREDETTTEFITTTTAKPARRGRKYHRRPRVQNFTTSLDKLSTKAPIRLGASARPFFPTRIPPNVTLSFANRAARRSDTAKTYRRKVQASQN